MLLLFAVALSSCSQTPTLKNNDQNLKDSNMIHKTDAEWKAQLSNEQYYVLREKGTERPFTGALLMNKEKGVYKCAGCGAELFTDDMKFDSHCGWPSFDKEIEGGKITQTTDRSHGMVRTEVTCATCGGHLGHVFSGRPYRNNRRPLLHQFIIARLHKGRSRFLGAKLCCSPITGVRVQFIS